MANWRGPGPLGTWTFGSIEDGTAPRTWAFPPQTTGGITTVATIVPLAFTLAKAATATSSIPLEAQSKITLPPKNTDIGVEVRVFLAECATPSSASYTIENATRCMQLMDRVLWNRMNDPGRFGARGAKSLADVVRGRNQFAGFAHYPNYDADILHRIQSMLDIANSDNDKRKEAFAAFVNTAITVANGPRIADPSSGILASWRTTGHGSPGPNFKVHETLMGNTFYYIAK